MDNPTTPSIADNPQLPAGEPSAASRLLADIYYEAQSELYPDDRRASGRSLDFGHVGIADFVLWYHHRTEREKSGETDISKFDVQSVMLMFEEWVKAPLSANAGDQR